MGSGYSTPEHALPTHHTHEHIPELVHYQSEAEILRLVEKLVLKWLLELSMRM
jgi:hypothetical protein